MYEILLQWFSHIKLFFIFYNFLNNFFDIYEMHERNFYIDTPWSLLSSHRAIDKILFQNIFRISLLIFFYQNIWSFYVSANENISFHALWYLSRKSRISIMKHSINPVHVIVNWWACVMTSWHMGNLLARQ